MKISILYRMLDGSRPRLVEFHSFALRLYSCDPNLEGGMPYD